MTVDVPSGRYAVDVGGGERLVLVEDRKVRGLNRDGIKPKKLMSVGSAQVLTAIAKDRVAAALSYTRRCSRCCVCGRELSADQSLARAIGPVCFERLSATWSAVETERFVNEFSSSPVGDVEVAVG